VAAGTAGTRTAGTGTAASAAGIYTAAGKTGNTSERGGFALRAEGLIIGLAGRADVFKPGVAFWAYIFVNRHFHLL